MYPAMNRKHLTVLVSVLVLTATVLVFKFRENQTKNSFSGSTENDESPERRALLHRERLKYEFDMVKDPATGKIPEGIYQLEMAQARSIPEKTIDILSGAASRVNVLNTYFPAGPNNIGGRTRALAYDVRYDGTTNRVIMAGSVSGGIMRSVDGGATWTRVSPENDIHNLTSLAQDPRPGFQNTWYAGGGEYLGNSASELGAFFFGQYIWKSVDNGATWARLPTNTIQDIPGNAAIGNSLESSNIDHPFDLVHKIAVNPANGHLYVCGHRRLIRSTDGGATFQTVFGSTVGATSVNGQMDVVISNTGKILLGVNGGNPDPNLKGIWTSTSGALNSFTRIAGGQNLGVDSVDGWRGNTYAANAGKRVVLNYAPSNQNIAYILYENGLSNEGANPKPEADLFRLDMTSGNSWSNRSDNMPDFPGFNNPATDPFEIQGGYDMHVHIKPNDPNFVIVGGSSLYRSTDGFASTANTAWIGGYSPTTTATALFLYPNSHPDMHNLSFNPSNPNEAISANDGGLQITTNITAFNSASAPVAWQMIPNYQTLQYYYVAMDPEVGKNNFIGGAQDNGTWVRDKTGIAGVGTQDSNNHRRVISGDGTAVGFGTIGSGGQFAFGGFQLGGIRRIGLGNSPTQTDIMPSGLTGNPGGGFGEFVTNFKVNPDNTDDLYYVNFNRLFRTTASNTVSSGSWTELTNVGTLIDPNGLTGGVNVIRGMGFSRGPYATSHVLYLGTSNGKIYRINDPRNVDASYTPTEITPVGSTGSIQDIAVNPNNDDEVMFVASNYGVVSVWWSNNAKSANPIWKNVEGNLTLPSFRSCMIVVKKDAANQPVTEYYVGTSVGLYSAVDIGNGTPNWQREGGNVLNFAVIQSMAYRPGDNVLLLGTHGNGMYYTQVGTPNYTPNLNTGVTPVTNDRNFIRFVGPTLSRGTVQYATGNMTGIKKLTVQLTDLSGKVVVRKETGYVSGSVDLSPLATGSYILTIYSSDGQYRHIQKLLKQ
jgi:hypothetical protein